jgi:hypothetical protein
MNIKMLIFVILSVVILAVVILTVVKMTVVVLTVVTLTVVTLTVIILTVIMLTDVFDIIHTCLMLVGRVLSQTSMSLANLLTIRPRGVVSKKDIGLCITLSRSFLCIS